MRAATSVAESLAMTVVSPGRSNAAKPYDLLENPLSQAGHLEPPHSTDSLIQWQPHQYSSDRNLICCQLGPTTRMRPSDTTLGRTLEKTSSFILPPFNCCATEMNNSAQRPTPDALRPRQL